MKKLNQNGIKKVLRYLGRDFINESTDDLKFSVLDFARMAKIGVFAESIDNRYNLYIVEQGEIDDPEVADMPNTEKQSLDNNYIKNLVSQLAEPLSELFPTKSDVNQALEDLKASMIDPQEWEDMLNMWKKMIQKGSKSTDAVG